MNEEQRLRRLLRAIEHTPDEAIDCSACLNRVPVLVDREVSGGALPPDAAALRQHLDDCHECFDEYQALRELAALEAAGALPSKEALLRTLEQRTGGSGAR